MLEMKYFILKPRAKRKNDPFAIASRQAMMAYADSIKEHDPILALELNQWATKENEAPISYGLKQKWTTFRLRRNEKMQEEEKNQWLMLGELCERERLGKRFHEEAGESFAIGLDEQARKLREISRELLLSAKQMREEYDEKYHN